MEKLEIPCLCCGKCCLASFIAYTTGEDVNRWRREGRREILQVIERRRMIWVGDRLVSAEDGLYAHECPFLLADGSRWLCSIYETRPQVCQAYRPGSSEICPQWVPEV